MPIIDVQITGKMYVPEGFLGQAQLPQISGAWPPSQAQGTVPVPSSSKPEQAPAGEKGEWVYIPHRAAWGWIPAAE